jgi:hypothetical protein
MRTNLLTYKQFASLCQGDLRVFGQRLGGAIAHYFETPGSAAYAHTGAIGNPSEPAANNIVSVARLARPSNSDEEAPSHLAHSRRFTLCSFATGADGCTFVKHDKRQIASEKRCKKSLLKSLSSASILPVDEIDSQVSIGSRPVGSLIKPKE